MKYPYDITHPALRTTSDFQSSETGSGLDRRFDSNSRGYLGTPQERIARWEASRAIFDRPVATNTMSPMGKPPTLITGKLGARRQLAPAWRRLHRAAKWAKRKGYRKAAEELGLKAAEAKLNTPSVITQDYRWAESQMQQQAQQAAMNKRSLLMGFYESLKGQPASPYGEVQQHRAYTAGNPYMTSGKRPWVQVDATYYG